MPRPVNALLQRQSCSLLFSCMLMLILFCAETSRCTHLKFSSFKVELTFNASLNTRVSSSQILLSFLFTNHSVKVAFLFCPGTLCCTLVKFSLVSVVLTFNASLSARTPSTPILLPALFDSLKSFPCVALSCCCYIPFMLSADSAVLTFNASPIKHAPSTPISFPAFVVFCLCCFLSLFIL